MSKTPRPEGDGYAVEVSLLKLRPVALALTVACFVAMVALLGWLGGGRPLAASKRAANHAANNHEPRTEPSAIPNNATSRTAQAARAGDKPAAEASPDRDAVPGPSPAGFAENTAATNAPGNTPADTPAAPEVPPTAVAAAAPADAATNATPAPSAGGYAVQTGSYATVSEANESVSVLRAAGFEARAAAVEIAKRGTWYRVYSGRFASREEAAQHDRKMRAAGAVAQTIITPVQD